MATIIISVLLLVLIVFCIRNIHHQDSCSKGCGSCSKGCMQGSSLYEAYKKGEHQNI
ncbi:FeoB-associated Cys-rich membrane protein [Erysipelotrichaceae bacterium HCN-30851]